MTAATETELAIIPKETALTVLTDPERFNEFVERVAKTVRGVPADLTTAAGRKAVAALAFKVVKSKTAILAAADELTEDARTQIKKVNASKADIETRLNALRDEVRKPLTDWEAAEEEREKAAREMVGNLRLAAVVRADETAGQLEVRRLNILENVPDAAVLGDHFQIAMNLRDTAVESISAGIERAKKAESDAAELATLRAQQEARDAEDQSRRDKEAQEKADREAEEKRAADEKAEHDRQAARDEEIAAAARAETQRKADEASAAALEEERKKTAAAEAETKRFADEKAAREAQEAADAASADKRAKDRAHKAKVMGAAKDALIEVMSKAIMPEFATPEVQAAIATTIVRAIVAGEIPAVTLAF